jgi:hypothetical protein
MKSELTLSNNILNKTLFGFVAALKRRPWKLTRIISVILFIVRLIPSCYGSISMSIQSKLIGEDSVTDDRFGCDVSIFENSSLIGACRVRSETGTVVGKMLTFYNNITIFIEFISHSLGSVYYYTMVHNQWSKQLKFAAADGASEDQFGHAVSMQYSSALIGAPGDSDNSGYSGKYYVHI